MQQFQTKMKALRVLENEHMLLRSLMHEWFSEMQIIKTCPPLARFEHLNTIRKLLTEFIPVLIKHQEKESRFFFPILGSYIGTDQGPIITIEAEHDEMMQYFEHFLEVTKVMNFEVDDIPLIMQDLSEGYEICMVHMYKEENVLFPMAEKVFKIKDEDLLLETVNTKIL